MTLTRAAVLRPGDWVAYDGGHRRRRALLQLERLGYRVTLEAVVT